MMNFILGRACITRTSRAQRAALTPPVRIEGADFRPGMATLIAMTSTSSSFALGASPSRPRRVAPSPSPVRPRHRRWTTTTTMTSASAPGGVKANVKAEPPTPPIPAAADRLETLLAEPYATLGDAVRAPNDRRAAIVACVSEMEKRNPTPAPARSATQTGDWTLRYTTSAGTMGSIAAWETVAGAVTDVAQRVDAVSDGDVMNVQNEVSVSLRSRADAVGLPLPPLALLGVDDDDVLTLRITQRFESRTQSRGRLSTKLLTSDVELRSRRKKGGGTKGAGGSSERTLGSFRQPGTGGLSPKTQLVTYLDDRWRVIRDDGSVSVYRRR